MNKLLLLALCPMIIALLGLVPRTARWLPKIAAVLMIIQLPIVGWLCSLIAKGEMLAYGPFVMDGIGTAFTVITTLVAVTSMIQAAMILPAERIMENPRMTDRRFTLFYTLSALFILTMYAVPLATHLGYLWIMIEATTLMSAPLIDYHRSRGALEATWKYLLLCSVGIAFALFGTMLIFASQHGLPGGGTMIFNHMIKQAQAFDPRLLRLGFVFCLLGYGTKAGIFPLHNWLPDAHSEAPSTVSALLSGALLNCALVAIWRLSQVMLASSQAALVHQLLVPAGAITVIAASLMLVSQHDLKRMLAYSSVEHIGLLTLAIGIGSGPVFILQAFNHSIVKVAFFLLAGNILYLSGTKLLSKLSGILKTVPLWGILLTVAAFAIAGSPPFGVFISEWLLLSKTFAAKEWLAAIMVIVGLTVTFIAISTHIGQVLFGKKINPLRSAPVWGWAIVPMSLLLISLLAGVSVTPSVMNMLTNLVNR